MRKDDALLKKIIRRLGAMPEIRQWHRLYEHLDRDCQRCKRLLQPVNLDPEFRLVLYARLALLADLLTRFFGKRKKTCGKAE